MSFWKNNLYFLPSRKPLQKLLMGVFHFCCWQTTGLWTLLKIFRKVFCFLELKIKVILPIPIHIAIVQLSLNNLYSYEINFIPYFTNKIDQCLCPLPECNFHENQEGVCFLHYYISIIKYSIQEVLVEWVAKTESHSLSELEMGSWRTDLAVVV